MPNAARAETSCCFVYMVFICFFCNQISDCQFGRIIYQL